MKLLKIKSSVPQQVSGIVMASIASISFGFIPLFSLPLMAMGMQSASILVYRFLFSSLFLIPWILYKKIDMRIQIKELLLLLSLVFFYLFSALGLQLAYSYMSSGVATVLHFTYPIFVILLLFLFFRQKPSGIIQIAILLAFLGVLCISGLGNSDNKVSLAAFFMVICTGLSYASYMIIVNKTRLSRMNNFKLSFYVLFFCSIAFFIIAQYLGGLQLLTNKKAVFLSLSLALIPTFLSNIMLIEGVKRCGSTHTSILGALEPLTAVLIGIFIFQEHLTIESIVGIFLILISVLLVTLSGKIKEKQLLRKKKRI